MANIVLRAGKGSPLTNAEVDANFTNLNTEVATAATTATWAGVTGKPATLAGYGITNGQPLDADLTAIAALAGTSGFLKKTAANTWALDTNTYLTGITSGQVTTALGFTPYNATNPTGFITASASITGNAATATTLQNARTINGVSFNGSVNITVADATKLPLAGGTMAGAITFAGSQTWPTFNQNTTGNAATVTSITSGQVTAALGFTPYNETNPSGYTTNTGTVTSVAVSVPTGLSVAGSPITTSGTIAISLASGYSIPTTASQTTWNTASTERRQWDGGATNLVAATARTSLGLVIGTNVQAYDADLAAIAALAGTTGFLKKTAANTWALDTSAYLTGNQSISFTGDATGSGTTSVALTLANSGVTAGNYRSVTVDAKGRVTAGSNPTTLSGYGITDAINVSQKAVANGVATLDGAGLVPASQLPSYVDDVLEYANLAGFPATGEAGKIYVAIDTNKTYRWSGTTYIYITSGAVDSVAGKTGVVTLVKGDVGLGSVDNTADSAKNVLSATKLTTARTIGGVSFDGTASINLPGVNAAGNQSTTGNAASATVLQTARTINGTSFNGSANILTANWGTARTITIGSTGKSISGSADVSWSLAEIGANNASNLTAGTLPDARLTGTYSGFTHKMDGSNTTFTTPNSGTSNSSGRVVYGLAEYRSSSSAQVGAIVFIAPNTASTIMHRMRIEGMVYVGGPTINSVVQGYRTSGSWSNTSKISFGITDPQIRWGVTPDGKNCLILGDVGTSWSYPHIAITAAMFSHSGATDAYCTGWTVAVVTDLSLYTNVTASLPTSSLNTNVSGSATTLATARTINGVSFNGSANITVADATKLPLGGGTLTGELLVNFLGNNTQPAVNAALFHGFGILGNRSAAPVYITNGGGGGVQIGVGATHSTDPAMNFTSSQNTSIKPLFEGVNRVLHAANFNTYAPTLTGGGASGSWGISVTGSAATLTTGRTIALTGDVTYTSGSFNGSANVTGTATLANSGVTAGTYTKVTVDAKGRVTTGAALVAGDVPTLNQSTTGNAATATALQTARTIGGVSFNGTANINLPGVNAVGNQNTTGSAATLTTARSINGTTFNGSANITTANWGTARTINGSSINGSANVTTANWGTARTLTIGNTGKSVNGSANVAWSVGEIGAEYQQPLGVPRNNLGDPTVREMATIDGQFDNKIERHNIANIFVETSTDNVTWTAFSITDAQKRILVGGDTSQSTLAIPYGTAYFRIRMRATSYVSLNAFYAYWSASGHSTTVKVFRKHDLDANWTAVANSATTVSSWPGHLYLPHTGIWWHVSGAQGSHSHEVYVVFQPTWNATYPSNPISLYKVQWWGGYPAGKRNLYGTSELGDASFPAALSAVGAITQNGSQVLHAGNYTSYSPSLTGAGASGSWNISVTGSSASTTGNAATATALQTARTIGGVSFNGTANINLPGVNAAGNQSTTGNAATATALQTARTINGVSFNGTTNITVADATKLPLAGGTMTGAIAFAAGQTWPTFNQNTTGNAGSISNFTTTTSTTLGTDNATSAIGYISSISLLGQTDGALYSHVYSTSWKHNIYGDYRTGQLAVRGKNNGTWQAWRTVLDSSNYNSYSPTLTGAGASGSWGISVTGSSASTTGNAATATTLQTARTINGVSFNGSTNITITAAANGGNAATATTLQTARTINGVSFNGSANITVADATKMPLAGGTLSGRMLVSGNGNIVYSDSGGTYIPRPLGATYKTATATITGALTVQLPTAVFAGASDMLSFWVDIYDYATNESVSIFVYGYPNGSVGSWANCGATILTPRTDRDYNVRFGHDGTRQVVCIGEVTSTWNYPQVNVRDLQAGYTASPDTLDDGWGITFLTTLPTVVVTSSGNTVVAKQLQTARTIGGVSFNGTANINLPGVNIAGNQSTTGNAATATTLQTARTINGVSFNGSANITIADATKLSLAGGTLTGNIGHGVASSPWEAAHKAIDFVGGGHVMGLAGSVAVGHNYYWNGTNNIYKGAGRASSYVQSNGGHFWRTAPIGSSGATFSFDATSMTLSDTGVLTLGTNTVLHAGNYTSYSPSLTGSGASGSWSISVTGSSASTTGNAATATTLQTARTIGGVSFNGSANINLPGVNTAGTQNTSGTAAVATAATVTASATASAFKVPFANTTASTTGNYGLLQDSTATFTYNPSTNTLVVGTVSGALSGNATTATTLQTARTINGVSFNGSANITVADATKLPLSGGTLTGDLFFGTTAGLTRVIGGTSASNTTLVFQAGGVTGIGANLELTRDNYAFVDANETRIRSLDGATVFLTVNSAGITSAGNLAANSDERLKSNWRDLDADFLTRLADLKMGVYDRTDTGQTQVGVGAQSLQSFLPQAVQVADDGILSVAYGNAALVACVELAREVRALRAELNKMKGA